MNTKALEYETTNHEELYMNGEKLITTLNMVVGAMRQAESNIIAELKNTPMVMSRPALLRVQRARTVINGTDNLLSKLNPAGTGPAPQHTQCDETPALNPPPTSSDPVVTDKVEAKPSPDTASTESRGPAPTDEIQADPVQAQAPAATEAPAPGGNTETTPIVHTDCTCEPPPGAIVKWKPVPFKGRKKYCQEAEFYIIDDHFLNKRRIKGTAKMDIRKFSDAIGVQNEKWITGFLAHLGPKPVIYRSQHLTYFTSADPVERLASVTRALAVLKNEYPSREISNMNASEAYTKGAEAAKAMTEKFMAPAPDKSTALRERKARLDDKFNSDANQTPGSV